MSMESKKNVILRSATSLFAEKGYDATGIEEIAAKSEIPKSLIYYHFKSKENLLNTIIANFMDEYKQILNNCQVQGIEKISVYIDYLKKNKDCAKIMISESLKTGTNQTLLFMALAPLMQMETAESSNRHIDNAHWIAELFTSIIPSILFVCYEETWCDFF